MRPAPFRSAALTGGYDLDPDLPIPRHDGPGGHLAGLHVLRHLDRFVQSLHMELVITRDMSEQVLYDLTGDYDQRTAERELRRYRKASPGTLRRLLRHEPHRVPLLHMSGSSCLGWSGITWDGVHLDRYLRPGQLFALFPKYGHMIARANRVQFLHLLAWQAPFPTHSLVSWTDDAELLDRPQALDEPLRHAACRLFRTGSTAR